MLHMCVYMHSRFIENHAFRILEDGPLISEVVLSQSLALLSRLLLLKVLNVELLKILEVVTA
jgi:hypothetical protein